MEVKLTDLDELEDSLQDALDRIGELRAGTRVSSESFFSDPFMEQHTRYDSFEGFRTNAPVDLDVPVEDVSEEYRHRLNEYVGDATEFETWEGMQTQAAEEEIVDQLLSNTA